MTNYEMVNRPWWVERWLELLNTYRFKKRLERGRKYAKEGNILNIEFNGAKVLAKVQGTEVEPYQVSLSLQQFTDEDWEYIVETMAEKAIFSAQLLAGEMPDNIEEVFIANGLSVFPFTLSDIHSRCSCPDKANPCKHIAAVYYQLGDRFSEDPFVLFQLRGRTKEQILQLLRQKRCQDNTEAVPQEIDSEQVEFSSPGEETVSPAGNLAEFWHYDEPLESSLVVIAPSPESKTVLDVLGAMPLAASDAILVRQYLDQVYQTVSQQAMMAALKRES